MQWIVGVARVCVCVCVCVCACVCVCVCVCLPPRPKGHPAAVCLLPLGAQVNDEGGQVIHTVPLVGLVDQRLRRALGTPGCILWHVGAERIRGNQSHE